MSEPEINHYLEVTESFINQRKRNIRKTINGLIIGGEFDKEILLGRGLDLGSWIGASSSVLRGYGADVTSVEQSETQVKAGLAKGLLLPDRTVITSAEEYLSKTPGRFNFITFFGASSAADLGRVLSLAVKILNPKGFLLVTTMPKLEVEIDKLVSQYGGVKFTPASTYWWDAIGYLYKSPMNSNV